MNLFQPWILLRLLSAITIAALFLRASSTALRVLRHFDVARSNEGQLLLERRAMLAATYARVGAVAAAFDLGFGVLTADRLSHSLRGAMCAYGVFGQSSLGWISLGVSVALALVAGLSAQLHAFDATLPRLDIARPLALATVVVAPIALAHVALSTLFLLRLDLTATASCCSIELDGAAAGAASLMTGVPRMGASLGGGIAVLCAAIGAVFVARRPSRRMLAPVAALLVTAGVLGPLAVVLGVAPHAFETPHHLCPFCLLRFDVDAIGYPLFGALYLGLVWGLGAVLVALVTKGGASAAAFRAFAQRRLRLSATAWIVALLLGAGPIVRYAWLSGGTLLFQ